MIYEDVREGRFVDRPNRFVAHVELDGRVETCHVKNTGRCAELFLPGARVWVQARPAPGRRTPYDLIAVQKGERVVNVDSQAPNRLAGEWLAAGGLWRDVRLLRPERRHGESRFDFYLETDALRAFVEVKGVTLEEDGVAYFPDAPTLRGLRHLRGLADCLAEGYAACALFVVQMEGVRLLRPNMRTHPEFGYALRELRDRGGRVEAVGCRVAGDRLEIFGGVPVELP